jgi:hypothetical protein
MKTKHLGLVAVCVLLLATPASATNYVINLDPGYYGATAATANGDTFHFSFNNLDGGFVTGTIVLNAADTAANSVTIDTNTSGFGIGEYIGNPYYNQFTVTNGQITSAIFMDFGMWNGSGVTCCSLDIETNSAGLSTDPTTSYRYNWINANLTFTPAIDPVPLPGALSLFATGLAGLGLLGWRRKRKNCAAANTDKV